MSRMLFILLMACGEKSDGDGMALEPMGDCNDDNPIFILPPLKFVMDRQRLQW